EEYYGKPLRHRITVMHPLHPFSKKYFNNSNPELYTYSELYEKAAKAEINPAAENDCRSIPEIESPPLESADINEITGFFKNPSRHFAEKSLGIVFPPRESPLCSDEIFRLGGLEKWQTASDLIFGMRNGVSAQKSLKVLKYSGRLPPGDFGEISASAVSRRAHETLKTAIDQGYSGIPAAIDLDRRVADTGFRITGTLRTQEGGGLLKILPGGIKAADILSLWIDHLFLCLEYSKTVKSALVYYDTGSDKPGYLELPPLPEEFCVKTSAALIKIYKEGQNRPVPFFPETSYAAAASPENKTKAITAWEGGKYGQGEYKDRYISLLFAPRIIESGEFLDISMKIYGPLFEVINTEAK
ncbi:MAG: hypothetical protein ACLFQK_05530, partial [Fibrobacterota bacterium]